MGWQSLQKTLQQRVNAVSGVFLDLGPDETLIVLCGEPHVFAASPSKAGLAATPPAASTEVHVLINAFVPSGGAMLILGGGDELARQLAAYHYTCGVNNMLFAVKMDEDGFVDLTPSDALTPEVVSALTLVPQYRLEDHAAHYLDRVYARYLDAQQRANPPS